MYFIAQKKLVLLGHGEPMNIAVHLQMPLHYIDSSQNPLEQKLNCMAQAAAQELYRLWKYILQKILCAALRQSTAPHGSPLTLQAAPEGPLSTSMPALYTSAAAPNPLPLALKMLCQPGVAC